MNNHINKETRYKVAGVNIEKGNELVQRLKKTIDNTNKKGVIGELGGFGGLFDLSSLNYQQPVLVSGTDGVGTKIKIAQALGRHDTVGIDIVNHCINDLLPSGATPLFFLDYIGISRFNQNVITEIVNGLADACSAANCALLGGETATLPGNYHEDDYDMVGFIVGTVSREKVLLPKNTSVGDFLIGLPSSGLHTNGFSLVRRVFGLDQDASILKNQPSSKEDKFIISGESSKEELISFTLPLTGV